MVCLQPLLLLLASDLCVWSMTLHVSNTASPNKLFGVKTQSRETAAVNTTATSAGDSEEDSDEDEDIDWQCGTDDFTRLISGSTIDRDCPELKVAINDCCIVHDSCYDKQLGRKNCDDTFCNCLDNVTRSSAICYKEDGPTFCGLVRQFGELPYDAAAKGFIKKPETSVISSMTTPEEARPPRPTPKRITRSTQVVRLTIYSTTGKPKVRAKRSERSRMNSPRTAVHSDREPLT
uniref:Phospholipase A2 domain-containing protein n=1 Tax=Ascaris lumbricoides TaxID=6252 RepID=A0A9J2P674_ASCLU